MSLHHALAAISALLHQIHGVSGAIIKRQKRINKVNFSPFEKWDKGGFYGRHEEPTNLKEGKMKSFFGFFILAIVLASCAATIQSGKLDEVKAGMNCVEYKEGLAWKEIKEKMGTPDIAPLPEPGTDLSKNTRIYKDKIIIFYTERQEVEEGGKVRFKEIVSKIEICK